VKREHRLRSAADFARVRQLGGRGWAHPLLVLYVGPNELGITRVGITVSGRVGKAVVRNRVRRRVREALRARLPKLEPGRDVVVVARPPSKDATWSELSQALDSVLGRARLWQPNPKTAAGSNS
jgi:ribonuclease P protein component